jgi:hypothetical protein
MKKRIILLLSLITSTMLLTGCVAKEQPVKFSQLGAISELATLRCYYHNVAKYTNGENSLFKFNYKRIWMEYSGIVTVGIDVSKVTASSPDQNDVVKVTIPKAKVLDIDFDEDSISELIDTGIFASISAKEKTDAFAYAQADMETTAKENASILAQGQDRAKKVIEQYIQKVGMSLGKTYSVEWVEVE